MSSVTPVCKARQLHALANHLFLSHLLPVHPIQSNPQAYFPPSPLPFFPPQQTSQKIKFALSPSKNDQSGNMPISCPTPRSESTRSAASSNSPPLPPETLLFCVAKFQVALRSSQENALLGCWCWGVGVRVGGVVVEGAWLGVGWVFWACPGVG